MLRKSTSDFLWLQRQSHRQAMLATSFDFLLIVCVTAIIREQSSRIISRQTHLCGKRTSIFKELTSASSKRVNGKYQNHYLIMTYAKQCNNTKGQYLLVNDCQLYFRSGSLFLQKFKLTYPQPEKRSGAVSFTKAIRKIVTSPATCIGFYNW